MGLAADAEELAEMLMSRSDPRQLLNCAHRWPASVERGRNGSPAGPLFLLPEVKDESVEYSRKSERLAEEPTITGIFLRRILARLQEAGDEGERRLLHRALTKGLLALRGDGRSV